MTRVIKMAKEESEVRLFQLERVDSFYLRSSSSVDIVLNISSSFYQSSLCHRQCVCEWSERELSQ